MFQNLYNYYGCTWEEDVEAVGNNILAYKDIEDVESYFVEEIADYLEN